MASIIYNRAASDPTVLDDVSRDYANGSSWTNTITSEIFVLLDNTSSNAVWDPLLHENKGDITVGFGNIDIGTANSLLCGPFTSLGIDDNATGARLVLADAGLTVGATAQFTIDHAVNDQTLILSGGISDVAGANIVLHGGGHLTLANDIIFRANATDVLVYDNSAATWNYGTADLITTGSVSSGSFSSTGIVDNADAIALTIDVSERVNIGRSDSLGAETGALTVSTGTSAAATASANADDFIIENDAAAGITIATPNTVTGSIYFADPQSSIIGGLRYSHVNDELELLAAGAVGATVSSTGTDVVGLLTSDSFTTTGAFTSLGIDDNATSVAITIDASENVGIGSTVPGLSRTRIDSNGFTNDTVLKVSGSGISGGQIGPFYGIHVDANANNNATARYGIYAEGLGGGGGPNYGIYGTTTMGSSTRLAVGVAGHTIVNSAATNNTPTAAFPVAGVMATIITTGTTMTADTTALLARNNTVYGKFSYGAYIDAVAGPTTVIPLLVASDGVEVLKVDSVGDVTTNGLILPLDNDAATPTIRFGDGDTGFYESADDTISVAILGLQVWNFTANYMGHSSADQPQFRNVNASGTIPNIVPSASDVDTGIGHAALDQLSLIAGAKEMIRLVETGVATTDQVIIAPAGIIGAAATPSLAFGDGNTGFFESADNVLHVSVNGVSKATFVSTGIQGNTAGSYGLVNSTASATVPSMIPNKSDFNTGIGSAALDQLSLIAGGVEQARFNVTGNHVINSLLDVATGDEAALSLNYTVNKLTSGVDTGLLINKTDTDSNAGSLLIDAQIGGITKFSVDDAGNTSIIGNLIVSGTTVTVNSETLIIDDNIIVLNNNETGVPSENAGIEVERGSSTNVLMRWNETTETWQTTNDGLEYFDIQTADTVDDTPVDAATTVPISSNWAYDHITPGVVADPHTQYLLNTSDTLTGGLYLETPSFSTMLSMSRSDLAVNDVTFSLSGGAGGSLVTYVGGTVTMQTTAQGIVMGSDKAIGVEKGVIQLQNATHISSYDFAGTDDQYIIGLNASDNITLGNGQVTIDGGTGAVIATGAVTVQGAFTSLGIDDNATSQRLRVSDASTQIGQASVNYALTNLVDDTSIVYSGGSGGSSGANIIMYGGAHLTLANDMAMRGGATTQLYYDDSTSDWNFQANSITTTGNLVVSGTVDGIDVSAIPATYLPIAGISTDADNFLTLGADSLIHANDIAVFEQQGANLLFNGSGNLGDNTNFTGMTYDESYAYVGKAGFYTNTYNTSKISPRFINVDITQAYKLSGWVIHPVDVGQTQYLLVSQFDSDENQILPQQANPALHVSGSETTLAVAWTPGDPTMTLTDASGWNAGAANRAIKIYPYTNTGGYTYPDHEYTRHADIQNFTIVGNVVTLLDANPSELAKPGGGAWPIGTPISQSASSGTFIYPWSGVPTTAWQNVGGTVQPADWWWGVAKVKTGFLVNYNIAGGDVAWAGNRFEQVLPADFTVTGAFTSLGIDDNADAIAITIDVNERVGIGAPVPRRALDVKIAASVPATVFETLTNGIVSEFRVGGAIVAEIGSEGGAANGLIKLRGSNFIMGGAAGYGLGLGYGVVWNDVPNDINQINMLGDVGINQVVPTHNLHVKGTTGLYVEGTGTGSVSRIERGTGALTDPRPVLALSAVSSADVADGFGPMLQFDLEDTLLTPTQLGAIGFIRDGADGTGKFVVGQDSQGSGGFDFTVDSAGDVVANGILLALANDPATPTLAFGDGDTGFYESADDALRVSIAGAATWILSATALGSTQTLQPQFQHVNTTATVPNILPASGDANTGIGQAAFDQLSLIAGGVEQVRLDVTGNHIVNSLLDVATTNEVALSLNYTVNKLTSGTDTGLLISKTDTDSNAGSLLADMQVGAVTQFSVTDTGDVNIIGNLTVSGTTTTLNTATVTIDDNIIVLNNNEAGAPSLNAGIEIERGTSANVQMRWNETSDTWQVTNDGTTYYDIRTAQTDSGANTGDVTLAGTPDYITITDQVITRNQIVLTTDVSGILPEANGGTGVSTIGAYKNLLEPLTWTFADTVTVTDNTFGLALQAGNSGALWTTDQITLGYAGSNNYRHAIKTRHAAPQDLNNAIGFFLWDFGVDAIGDVGTFEAFTIDQTVSTFNTPLTSTGDVTANGLILPLDADASTPTIRFGDGDTGFYEAADDTISISIAGVSRYSFNATGLATVNTNGGALNTGNATATVPTLIPNKADPDTGIGSAAADQLSLIAGAVEGIRITEAAAVITVDVAGDIDFEGQLIGPPSDTAGLVLTSSTYSADTIEIGGWSVANTATVHRLRASVNLHLDCSSDSILYVNYYSGRNTQFGTNTNQVIITGTTAEVYPETANDGSLGTTGNRWGNLFVAAATITGTITADSITTTHSLTGDDTVTTVVTTATVLSSFAHATYGAGEFVIQATQGTDRHITKVLVTHDGTTAIATEYGEVITGVSLYTVTVAINGANVEVSINTVLTTSTVYKATYTLIEA